MESAEIFGKVTCGEVTIVRVMCDRLEQDRFEIFGDRRIKLPGCEKCAGVDLFEEMRTVSSGERGLADQEFIEGKAQAIDITTRISLGA